MREFLCVGREAEYYRGRYHDVVPSEQRFSYAQSRSGRSQSRTMSRGVTQPLSRDPRDPGMSSGGGTGPEMMTPSRASDT